jgi:hypothetical protein
MQVYQIRPLLLALIILPVPGLVSGCAQEPGSFTLDIEWDEEPADSLWLWVRVEQRTDVTKEGPILASNEPARWIPGEPLSVGLSGIPNGDSRVLVIEAREEKNSSMAVLYFGVSEPFSIQPNEHTHVSVPMKLQRPEADAMEASMHMEFGGDDTRTSVTFEEGKNASIVISSSGAVGVAVANDASFSANLQTLVFENDDSGLITCTQEEPDADGLVRTSCTIDPWCIMCELPTNEDGGNDDGLYSVYLKFVDRYGYESVVFKDSVFLDTEPPGIVAVSLTPEVAKSGDTVALSVSFHEKLHSDISLADLTVTPSSDTLPPFSAAEQVGTSNAYVWKTEIPSAEVDDDNVYTFTLNVQDGLGNERTSDLVDSDGEPVELRLDAAPPVLVNPDSISFNKSSFGLAPKDGGVELFSFEFTLRERSPVSFQTEEDGLCTSGCPVVKVGNKEVGKVSHLPDNSTENEWTFRYDFEVDESLFGAIDQDLGIFVTWEDGAGNKCAETLEEPVHFDFIRPGIINCVLAPPFAGAGDQISYSLTATEPLLIKPPALTVDSDIEGIFGPEAEVIGSEQTFTWVHEADEGLEFGDYTLSVVLVDQAGNESDGQVCSKTGHIDTNAPFLDDIMVPTYETLFGLNEEEIPGLSQLSFDFRLVEDSPGELGIDAGPCTGNCPVVLVHYQELGKLLRKPELDEPPSIWGFHFEYTVDPAYWGNIDESAGLDIEWTDSAGNFMNIALAEPVHFDFIRPHVLDCSLTPAVADLHSTIAYLFTVSEELFGEDYPQLLYDGTSGVFDPMPEISGGGLTYSWSSPAQVVDGDTFAVAAVLKDLAGNLSKGDVCSFSIDVDTSLPQISEQTIVTLPEVIDHDGNTIPAVNHGDEITVSFTVSDNRKLSQIIPTVQMEAGQEPVMLVLDTITTSDDAKQAECIYKLSVTSDAHSKAEGSWPVRVTVEDEAGNYFTEENLTGELVRLDFTPPVADCTFITPAGENGYIVGDNILLQVLPFEELDLNLDPTLVEKLTPDFVPGPFLAFLTGSMYQFKHKVVEGDGEHAIEVKAVLTDLVGNQTPDGEDACEMSLPVISVDGTTPSVLAVTEVNALDRPYRAGETVTVEVDISTTPQPPLVFVGNSPMEGQGEAVEQTDGSLRWTYARILEGTEGEGLIPIRAEIYDLAGNFSNNESDEPEVSLDFTHPTADCILNLQSAKAGDQIKLTVVFSELLEDEPTVETTVITVSPEGNPVVPENGKPQYIFTHHVDPQVDVSDEWTYAVYAKDKAGNPADGVALCQGTAYADSIPIAIGELSSVTAAFEYPQGSGNWFETGQVARDGSVITIVFSTDMKPAQEPELMVGPTKVTLCSLEDATNEYTCTFPVTQLADEVYENRAVTVSVQDEAGNMTHETLAMVTLDFAPPELAATANVNRCDDSQSARMEQDKLWIPIPAELAHCTYAQDNDCDGIDDEEYGKVEVSFAISESVIQNTRKVVLGNDIETGTPLTIHPCASSDNFILARYEPTGTELEDVCVPLQAQVVDLAGNLATLSLGCLQFDFTPPVSPAQDPQLVRLYRDPWGSSNSGGLPEIRVEGCPGFDFCGEDETGAAEAEAQVRIYDTSAVSGEVTCTSNLIATGFAGDSGNFAIPILADQHVVCVSQVDDAGNEGGKAMTRLVRWMATLNNKSVGDLSENPHRLYQANPFEDTVPMLGPETREVDSQSLLNGVMSTEGTSTVQSSEEGAWRQGGMGFISPPTLSLHAMTYVASSQQVLLFGGTTSSELSNDLWEYKNRKWRKLCTSDECLANLPDARYRHFLWYDQVTDKVILYGGSSGGQVVNDMWQWDGIAWTEINQGPVLPPFRQYPQAAFDSLRGVVVLFSGISFENSPAGEILDDLWEFDGLQWNQVCDSSPCVDGAPPGRYKGGMTFDSTNGRVLMHGGTDSDPTDSMWGKNDFWSWDGSVWTDLCPLGKFHCVPTELSADDSGFVEPRMVWDSTRNMLVMTQGWSDSIKQIGQTVYANTDTAAYVFEWDGTEWTRFRSQDNPACAGDWPCGRMHAAIAYDSIRNEMVLFGGSGDISDWGEGYEGTFNDTWVWKNDHSWSEICTSGACAGWNEFQVWPAAGYYPETQETLQYGGGEYDSVHGTNKLWAYNGNDWYLKCGNGSCGSATPNLMKAFFILNGKRMLLFGGESGLLGSKKTYSFKDELMLLLNNGEPHDDIAEKLWGCADFDTQRGRVVYFGGHDGYGSDRENDNSIWELDVKSGTGWSHVTDNCTDDQCFPPHRSGAACAYFPKLSKYFIFGGQPYFDTQDDVNSWLYSWDGQQWSTDCDDEPCLSSAPPAVSWGKMMHHKGHKELYLFGGYNNSGWNRHLWKWDGSSEWTKLCPYDNCEALLPPARMGHGMAYDSDRKRLIVMAGKTEYGGLGGTYEWTTYGVRPSLIAAFDVGSTQTIKRTIADPQEKRILTYRPRIRAEGTGYRDGDKLDGYRIFVSSFGSGPWSPVWEVKNTGQVDTEELGDDAVALVSDWNCADAPAFDPPEDPDGTGSRVYCEQATVGTLESASGKVYLAVTTRGGGDVKKHASIDLDYVELTLDYYRTGCLETTEDGTSCDDGDSNTTGETCQNGHCISGGN